MNTMNNALANFFGVAVRGQTYLNALYLLLAFPLGLFYFVFLVTGIATGVPLIIIWIGLFILAGVFAAWYGLIAFERMLAIGLLHEKIAPLTRENLSGKSLWQKFVYTIKNPVTWKGLVYLLAKFPLGLISFVVMVTLISVSVSLVAAPFYYNLVPGSLQMTIDGVYYTRIWQIDTMPEAALVCLVGLILTLVSMHVFNGLAWVSGKFAKVMLGSSVEAPAAPQAPVAPVMVVTAPEAPQAAVETPEPAADAPAAPVEEPPSSEEAPQVKA